MSGMVNTDHGAHVHAVATGKAAAPLSAPTGQGLGVIQDSELGAGLGKTC